MQNENDRAASLKVYMFILNSSIMPFTIGYSLLVNNKPSVAL